MPWMMPVAVGGAALLGDVMSQQGQQATNAQSTANMLQSENWQEYMSDTQMQRRVTDLKAAGLNPMLAVGGPGAAMGSPVMPSLQNPQASFGNLGAQVSNAAQAATISSQVRKTNADAAYTESLTPRDDVIPVDDEGHVSLDSIIRSPGGLLGKMSVAQAAASLQQTNATIDNLKSSTDLNKSINSLRQVDLSVAKASAQAVIQKAVNDAGISGAELSIDQARAKVLSGPMGTAIQAAESVLGGGFVGQVIGSALSKLGGSRTTETSHIGPGGTYRGGSITTTR